MTRRSVFLGVCFLLSLAMAAFAQSPSPYSLTLGKTTVSAPKFHANLRTFDVLLWGGVTVSSPDYDLKGEKVTISGGPIVKGSQPSIAQVVVEGDPGRGIQVMGHFSQADPDRTYTMQADQATFVPDSSRPHGGRIDLIGHPKLTVTDPKQLAEPAVITGDHIIVLLGDKPDYPQVDGENGHMTFTPNQ